MVAKVRNWLIVVARGSVLLPQCRSYFLRIIWMVGFAFEPASAVPPSCGHVKVKWWWLSLDLLIGDFEVYVGTPQGRKSDHPDMG